MKSKLFKRNVALISALAMAASTFIVPITANAATTEKVSTVTYETDGTAKFKGEARAGVEVITGSGDNTTKVERIYNSGGSNGYATYLPLSESDTTNKIVNYEFDLYMNTRVSRLSLSAGAQRDAGTNIGRALTLDIATNDNTVKVNGTTVGTRAKWHHIVADVNNLQKVTSLKVYDYRADGNYSNVKPTYSADNIPFFDSSLKAVTGFDFIAPNNGGDLQIDNIKMSVTDVDAVAREIKYVVDGITTTEFVIDGEKPSAVPATDKIGYIFKGWAKDGDTSNLISTDTLTKTGMTADTTFTAVYEVDTSYIEPMVSAEFTTFPANGLLTAGADENTAASNIIGIKITGERGTDLSANPDSRVTDFDVQYELKGFRWVASKNEPTTDVIADEYCDSYGKLVKNENKTIDFQIKNHPFNYYGEVVANITYNGKKISISRSLAYLGNTANQAQNIILPRGGYISDYNSYAPDMVGYKAAVSANNTSSTDVVTDNWSAYGGNSGRGVYISEEEGNKFLKLKSTGTNSSSFAANQIEAVTDTQVVFKQKVRFYNSGSSILLKSANPVTWNENATSFSVNFTGNELNINGNKITGATTGVWYEIIVTSDVTSGRCYAIVNDASGNRLGQSEVVDFTNAGSKNPKYYMFRTPDNSVGELDFKDVTIYRAEMNAATVNTTASATTLAIPEEGTAPSTANLTVSAKTTEGYEAIGAATWTVANDTAGITVTPSAEDSHMATINVDSTASAGTATVNVTIGGTTKQIDFTITASKDSIKFAEPVINSVSIPLDSTNTVVSYPASVIDKDGNGIAGKTVSLALYDQNNVNPVTLNGITLENGVLTVTKEAAPTVVTIRATSTNSNNEEITNAVKVTIHGLAFDLGTADEEAVANGYTPVTSTTVYSEKLGYGIEGTATAGGTASLEDADTDYLEGNYTFKVNVENNKVYKVTLNYEGNAVFEKISTDLSGVVRNNAAMGKVEYRAFVHDGVLDIGFDKKVSSIVIEKIEREAGVKPHVYTVGDSTIANNGSWAYVLNRDFANYAELGKYVTFTNNGRGGKNLSSYYTGGELWDRVVTNIKPGDYVMIGDMGTNGMGTDFEGSFKYYVDACLALGAKVILNSYSPHGAVGGYASGYNSATQTFNTYRQDAYDNIVRVIYEERKSELAGFIDIGKNADAAFNAYVDDYAANGYASRDAAAQAIISCFSDHNHYSNGTIAAKLMIEGYGGKPGIVSELTNIVSKADALVEPTVNVSTPKVYTENDGAPAVSYTADIKANDITVTKLNWTVTVGENTKSDSKDVQISGGTDAVYGFVIVLQSEAAKAAGTDKVSLDVTLN